jgi:Tfp pilus assembly protein PilF
MIEPLLEAERNLNMGLLDQAERLYRQVVEHDERNAIAVVGLARVAIERGDDRRALELARRALAIDAQNAAAIRLEARLTELLPPTTGREPDSAKPDTSKPDTEQTERGLFRRLLGR